MEDANNKNKNLKAKIYYILALKTILFYNVFILAFFLLILRKKDIDDVITLIKYIKDNIKLVYVDSYKQYCYFILASFIIDYKKQVFIIDIKINIQYLIYYIPPKKKKK